MTYNDAPGPLGDHSASEILCTTCRDLQVWLHSRQMSITAYRSPLCHQSCMHLSSGSVLTIDVKFAHTGDNIANICIELSKHILEAYCVCSYRDLTPQNPVQHVCVWGRESLLSLYKSNDPDNGQYAHVLYVSPCTSLSARWRPEEQFSWE